ncbi:MAG: hypothetical protein QOE58_1497 [Actinomycetota bacterium]|jgi:serine/threonine protein kinase|nr:hypothetical protein [Actinomycetota bacterium]
MTVGLTHDDEAGSAALKPGQGSGGGQCIGPYRLIQPLGEGGMGVVHLALDPYGRAVAVKVLREHIAHDRDARDRLRREVETLALVQDPRVAVVLDADTEGPRPYIVTRYIHGPSLEKVVSEHGPVQGEALLRLGRGLWDGLNAIHAAGVIHRDLKPANVLLLDGDPVVIDFGIARVADDIRLTMTGLVMGTPGYLSPEVVEGAKVTEATDWWGWAATLAFAASGAPPFGRGPMNVVLDRVRRGQASLSDVDQRLAPILQAALSPIPNERPHAEEVLQALDWYAAKSPPTLAIPLDIPMGDAPSTRPYPRTPSTYGSGSDPAPVDAAGQSGPGRPSPPAVWPSRTGTMLALFVGVLGVASLWPMVAIGIVVLWSLAARFADRSITALGARRDQRGRRRSDVPVAVLFSPWHAIVSVVVTVLALVIPAVVAIGSTFSIALVSAAVTGGAPEPDRSLPVAAGGLCGLLMCWWGLGGGALRRGSRRVLGALTPGKVSVGFVVGSCVLIGFGLGAWAWWSHGQTGWWPWSLDDLRAITHLVR